MAFWDTNYKALRAMGTWRRSVGDAGGRFLNTTATGPSPSLRRSESGAAKFCAVPQAMTVTDILLDAKPVARRVDRKCRRRLES